MKAKNKRRPRGSASQLPLNFSKALPPRVVPETRASAEVVGLAQFRTAKVRDLLIADLHKSRVPK